MVWIYDPSDEGICFDPADEETVDAVVQTTRQHFLDPGDMNRCSCNGWVEGDDWDEHIVRVVFDALRSIQFTRED